MELFPAGLATTLFPAILLGVLVTFIATETLAWTFTGLVVPGYLASVALVSPRAALLMVIEALASLVVARLLSDGAARIGIASRFFGRERFFLLLSVATLIRLGLEHALHRAGMGTGDLAAHSIGLVLVPLMAHTLDKVGVGRGLAQLGALTLATGALVAFLVRFTNLSLSDLSLTFEDVAFSIDRSPKAYVVLLAGALLAARANVAFGWDFHGIIVPGLLAVAWFEPTKVLLTLLESVAALLLALGLLRLPGLRRMALEGPRRLVFVFIADAILRMVVVGALGSDAAFLRASDLYGFGYLLPTLLAVKIWQRGSLWRVTLPAAQVSLGGFLAGNALFLLLGAGANWLAPARAVASPAEAPAVPFARAVVSGRALVARGEVRDALSAAEMEIWTRTLERLADGAPPAAAARPLAAIGLTVSPLADVEGGVAIHENAPRLNELRGLGAFVARREGKPLVVAIPHPLDGDASVAAIDVAEALGARLVAVAGRPEASELDRLGVPSTPLHRSPWALARYVLGDRGWTWLSLDVDERAPAGAELRLRPGKVPSALDLAALRRLFPDLRFTWSREPETVLVAPAATWRRLAARPCADLARVPSALATRQLVGDAAGADELDPAEQLLFARDVVTPLAHGQVDGSACRVAALLGLSVVTIVDADGARHAAVLPAERRAATVVVRLDKKGGTLVTAPHPDLEPYGRRAAVALYEALPARALLLGAENPSEVSSYDAAGEALASALSADLSVVEVRGAGRPPLVDGAVIAWGGPSGTPPRIPAWLAALSDAAKRAGITVRPWDGGADEACCGDLGSPWRRRLARLGRDRHASIYLSTALRERRFGPSGSEAVVTQAVGLGIPRRDGTLAAALSGTAAGAPDKGTFALLRRFAELRHAGDLAVLARRPGVRMVVDGVTGEAFLLYAAGRAVGVVNLRDPGPAAAPTLELQGAAGIPADALASLRHGGLVALWRTP